MNLYIEQWITEHSQAFGNNIVYGEKKKVERCKHPGLYLFVTFDCEQAILRKVNHARILSLNQPVQWR